MIIKVFRPFWSYDIEKTENWLSTMEMEGYYFVKMNTKTRCFYFDTETHEENTYRIVYGKNQIDSLSDILVNNGWKKACHYRSWHVIQNNKCKEDIKIFPGREGIIKRNKVLMYIFIGIFIYMIASSLPMVFMILFALFNPPAAVNIEGSPMWAVSLAVGITLWTFVPYSAIKLYKTNERLEMGGANRFSQVTSGYVDKQFLKKKDQVIVKRKIAWQYSPDKLEKWLEAMEAQGYNLIRISKFGNKYYFEKDSPRKVSFQTDYQNTLNQEYYDMHKDAGWKLMYTNKSFLSKWSVWSKEFKAGEEQPQLYSDDTHKIKHARRVMLTYLLMFVPIIIMYFALIQSYITLAFREEMDPLRWSIVIIFGIGIIEFGTFAIKSILYYRRVKMNVQSG